MNKTEKEEQVNHPAHYNTGSKECIDAMIETFGDSATADFCLINAFKYLYRAGSKGPADTDIRKAQWYIDKYNSIRIKNEIMSRLTTPITMSDVQFHVNKYKQQ